MHGEISIFPFSTPIFHFLGGFVICLKMDRYEQGEALGEGGFAIVYKYRVRKSSDKNKKLIEGKTVAIKSIR